MIPWIDQDEDYQLLIRVTLGFVRRHIVAQLPIALPPEILDLIIADAAAAMLPYMVGVLEVDGELLPLHRGDPPPEPELV
ncbi:hypothetical protein KX816_10050 [Sphingosinicellaceae bacterium]|nr:hypothetical protein KX816_10050 [Sphingosinicellaceae bacterium]